MRAVSILGVLLVAHTVQARENPIRQALKQGQSIWYDNLARQDLRSGRITRLVKRGVRGITTNPTIFENAIARGTAYDRAILERHRAGASVPAIYESLVV